VTPHPDHEKNRLAWNEMAEVHYRHPDYLVREFLEGRSTLKSVELAEIGDVRGKALLHLFCQFGLDTLSWVRQGAIVTGVDISDTSIRLANELKEKAGLAAEFIHSDVLELIGTIDRTFDIVFQSYGTLCWIADVNRWAQVIVHHLKPGGIFYIIDGHPITHIYQVENGSYFDTHPERYSNAKDYCDRSYVIRNELVEWQHTLSSTINALIRAGLTIEFVNEFDKGFDRANDDWYQENSYWYPPTGPSRYPLMFSLRARKKS
jgi:SAM-dependent methyltransferase